MKKVTVEVDGKQFDVYAAKSTGGVLWVHMNGETFTYEVAKAKARGGKGAAHAPSEILAPMPGKIVKIQVQSGEKVAAGQVLLVMEAMKMEYTLKAHAEGEVERVDCQAGEQVALGQLLVKLSL